jgi:hypothetical protein
MALIPVALAFACVLALAAWVASRRRSSATTFDDFVDGIREAADEGGRAYAAQVEAISMRTRRPFAASTQGMAMARFLSALFPTAAYVALDSSGALSPRIRAQSPFSGKDAWNLASSVAFEPLALDAHPCFPEVVADARKAIAAYIDFLNQNFSGDSPRSPAESIAAAEGQLGALWMQALALSVGDAAQQGYAIQYCTSGLHLLAHWMQALGRRR